MTKAEYRIWAKGIRQKLDLKKISLEITHKVTSLQAYKSARTVMSYHSKDLEISLDDIMSNDSKSWFLPVIISGDKESIVVVPYVHGKTKLTKGKFGILEPQITKDNFFDQIKKKVNLDIIFVPGLCFDKYGNRIGFGKGFYDSFLQLNPKSLKVGCCPKDCFVDKLPVNLWDIKVDLVITN